MKVKEVYQKNLVCWACQKPHPRRKCPATNSYICPQCCGSKRKKEINCQDNCEYLAIAKSQWIQKLQLTPQQLDFWRAHFDLIHNIQAAVLSVKRTRFSDIKDIELKDALENLIKTYETEERGVFYEYKSSNYRIQIIIDSIQDIVNQHRGSLQSSRFSLTNIQKSQNLPDTRLRKATLHEIITSLRFMLDLVKQSIAKKVSGRAFFDFLSYFTGDSLITEDSRQ